MKNFILIKKDIDVCAIVDELGENDEAWKVHTRRKIRVQCQRETESIFLRVADRKDPDELSEEIHQSRDSSVSVNFGLTMAWLAAVERAFGGELGRALFARLPPEGRVYRHFDRGSYYAPRHRFHLVLQSGGSMMRCGDEEVVMQEGELWVFNNKKKHESFNDSSQARTHLIFDVLLRESLL